MDYEFRRDITGQVYAQFSMEHEVIGYWLNEEIKGDLSIIKDIQTAINTIAGSENQWTLTGHEYTLFIQGEEAMVRANQLDFTDEEMEEGLHYYDEESLAFCGVTDFLFMLERYSQFTADTVHA